MPADKEGAKLFETKLEEGTAFKYLFHNRFNGCLGDVIEWLSGWLVALKAYDRFCVMRYEDMVTDFNAHFNQIHMFLTGKSMDSKVAEIIAQRAERTKTGGDLQPGAVNARTYPRGYSGKIGIWRQYFTREDVEEYNTVVKNYIAYQPDASVLFDIYPDLTLDIGELVV
jgi:hypothetical protein